ncbi:serine/threonine-protein phosphatase 6 regulatory subunit 3 [Selaginella moellendorffii]|uniref:serine/threonine-protein phosphatase 6 regulatory subunit 3 n=1 Tax=Selaginella moellendorffii TaxID=88036 RepID=UPI000D1CD2F4|nr:serine/threonine-protein phosphatase 6 regulatory subunit 3 [Selaginella moellendorffii]|eukprot:XP_024540760.1 serine/threonine-protein phosphatase 6 regulatory subunit 3 [Selaginella moellendorffii]
MAGSFWGSNLPNMLESEECTLEEILNEDDVLQSCYRNQDLMKFLQNKDRMKKMISYAIVVPVHDDEKSYKYSFVSSAILSSEVDDILTTLACDEELMESLFSFLVPDYDRDDQQAGNFSRIVIGLLVRKTEELMHYIQNHTEVLQQMVDHIGLTSIMEVLMRLVGANNQIYTYHSEAVQWLAETELIDMLVDKLSSSEKKSEVHANAANTLCTVMRLPQSALALKLSSPRFVTKLFTRALENVNSKAILVHSLSVCISLLEPKGQPSTVVPETLDEMLQTLGEMLKVLDVSKDEASLPTTYGILRPPFGTHRLKIVEFTAALLRADPDRVGEVLVQHKALQRLLNLFFDYPFNNMLHHHVETVLLTCINYGSSTVVDSLFRDCNLVGRLLEVDKDPYVSNTLHDQQRESRSERKQPPRVGNIGHLTRIANSLTQSENEQVQRYLQDNWSWLKWKSTVLQERNTVENVYQWSCGRPISNHNRPLDSDEDDLCDRDYGISALAGNLTRKVFRYNMFDNDDTEEDAFFEEDSSEVIIKSARLCDEQESARLFGSDSPWFPFQDDLETNPDVTEDGQNIHFSLADSGSSSSSSGSDGEVVLGEDEDLVDTATSSNQVQHLEREGPRPKRDREEDEEDRQTLVGITSDLEAVDLDSLERKENGESSQFDGGTQDLRPVSDEVLVFEMDISPEQRNGPVKTTSES